MINAKAQLFHDFKISFDYAQSDPSDIESATEEVLERYLMDYPELKEDIRRHMIKNCMCYGASEQEAIELVDFELSQYIN